MNNIQSGSQPSCLGPADWFNGQLRIDDPCKGGEPARISGATVTFEPGIGSFGPQTNR